VTGSADSEASRRLRAHQLSEVLDETTPIHGFIFDLWRRDVPPHRVGREAWKATGHAVLHLVTTGRQLLQVFRPAGFEDEEAMAQQADLEEMPEGKEGVLDNVDHPASMSLTFELAEGAASLLSRYAQLTDGRGTWHRPSVWLDMLPDRPRAHVLLDGTVIGEARVAVEIWRSLRDLASEESLYADGFLDLRLRNGLLETGMLVCYYPVD
jgi:hypothetical protein